MYTLSRISFFRHLDDLHDQLASAVVKFLQQFSQVNIFAIISQMTTYHC